MSSATETAPTQGTGFVPGLKSRNNVGYLSGAMAYRTRSCCVPGGAQDWGGTPGWPTVGGPESRRHLTGGSFRDFRSLRTLKCRNNGTRNLIPFTPTLFPIDRDRPALGGGGGQFSLDC